MIGLRSAFQQCGTPIPSAMSFNRKAIVCAGLLFGGLLQTSPAADPAPLNSDAVNGLTLAGLSKILESTDLRRLPLRLVLDERIASLSPEDKTVPQIMHHVIMVEPGSKRLRYDRVDYGRSGNDPYVCSSFTDGVHSGRWESALRPADVPRLLKGDAGFVQRGGMLYVGPDVCYSADIVFRVMGLTMGGKPFADAIRELGDSAVLTPDAAGDGLLVVTKFKKLMLNAHGVLSQYFMFGHGFEGAGNDDLTIIESILVTETGHVGTIPVPIKMHRRFNSEGRTKESTFELRVADCRTVSTQEMIEATNPLLSKDTVLTSGKNGLGREKEMRAFGPVEHSKDLPKGGQ
jgi:hypothetical protein